MQSERATRRLTAVLAADVVGYSRLMGSDEAGTLARLKLLRRKVFAPTVQGHGGNIVKLMGDGALVEFASVTDAVKCALAIQDGVQGGTHARTATAYDDAVKGNRAKCCHILITPQYLDAPD